jgi:hypothetical protein
MQAEEDKQPENRIDASDYEDTLALFMIRLLQLQEKRHYQQYKPPKPKIHWNEGETVITDIEIVETDVDSELFVSYLAIVRQFWANNDALNVHRIKGILLYVARLQNDSELRDRLKERDRQFRDKWNNCSYTFAYEEGKPVVAFSQYELVNFWFNTVYFHTDPHNLGVAVPLLQSDSFKKWSRWQFEVYLCDFVRYAQELGREVLKVLWKGVLPIGKLHRLLEMFVPFEIAEERRRRSKSKTVEPET